jgi:hypothetical protein
MRKIKIRDIASIPIAFHRTSNQKNNNFVNVCSNEHFPIEISTVKCVQSKLK